MLNDMLTFNLGLLEGVASWLGSEPIIYLVGTVILCFVFKACKGLLQ